MQIFSIQSFERVVRTVERTHDDTHTHYAFCFLVARVSYVSTVHVQQLIYFASVPAASVPSARLGVQYGVNLFPSSVAARRKNSRQNVTARGVETTAHSAMMAARRSSRSSASRATTARGTAPSSSDSSSDSDEPSSSARRGRHRGHPQFIACVADARTCARGHASPLAHRPRRKKAHGVEESSPSRVRRRLDVDAGDADARRADPASVSSSSSSSRDTGVPTSSRSRTRVDIGRDARRRVRVGWNRRRDERGSCLSRCLLCLYFSVCLLSM